jgi:enoyl-CoA hydratase/carnithine racemase
LIENPYQRPELGPRFESTLCEFRCAALDAAEADLPADKGALLISSVGARAFSAGFDLSVMGNKDAAPADQARLLQMGVDLCLRLFGFRRPVVMASSAIRAANSRGQGGGGGAPGPRGRTIP